MKEKVKLIVIVISVLAALLCSMYICYLVMNNHDEVYSLIRDNIVCVIGLPWAALTSFILITLFETFSGDVKIKFGNVEFQGAASPLIMWIMIFLVIVGGIRILWMCHFF